MIEVVDPNDMGDARVLQASRDIALRLGNYLASRTVAAA
jgi:hypothetical protein